jgi:hypothetical protein
MRHAGTLWAWLSAGALFNAGAALADASPPPPTKEKVAPGGNLSHTLSQTGGVIHPENVDPGIAKPAPSTGDPNVIPPPATKGGPAAPKPK